MLRLMIRGVTFFITSTAFAGFAFTTTAWAQSDAQKIKSILAGDTAPFGVVFEIVESKADDLNWAIPKIKNYVEQLRQRFPDIGLAVVSHGKEEFGLMTDKQKKYAQVHKTVKSLVEDDKVPVHVCGTHASWYNVKPDAFPDYVDVTPAGPTEIANYEDMGYILVVIDK
ncbi:MAG: DsrE family protein [Gammaproteobacteria bacterium]|nr:DsrE family protein [Gammaproteobacteria bacterium]MDH5799752.1 DsrE family protein [Gammaproteobacteria bacterium]